jgi:glycine hydroxymethyltransferase
MALEHKPTIIVAGASAYSRTIDFTRFGAIAKKVGAYFMADIAHIAGLVAVGLHPTPFGHADVVTSTVHKTLRGARGGLIMTNDAAIAAAIDKEVMPGTQGGPLLHSIAGKAVTFLEALQPEFKQYQQQIIKNAQYFAQALEKRGYKIVSGGTDNHLFIVDLTDKGISGQTVSKALEQAGIVTSKSCVPNDSRKPWIGSGVRIGTPALTTRGMKEKEVEQIAAWFDKVIQHHDNPVILAEIRTAVEQLCAAFPIYS